MKHTEIDSNQFCHQFFWSCTHQIPFCFGLISIIVPISLLTIPKPERSKGLLQLTQCTRLSSEQRGSRAMAGDVLHRRVLLIQS
jgi:hypothetical protein